MNSIFLEELSSCGLLATWLSGCRILGTKKQFGETFYVCEDFEFFSTDIICSFVSSGQKFEILKPFKEFEHLDLAILIYENKFETIGEQLVKNVVKIQNFLSVDATFSIETMLIGKEYQIRIIDLKVIETIQGISDTIFEIKKPISVETFQMFLKICKNFRSVQNFLSNLNNLKC